MKAKIALFILATAITASASVTITGTYGVNLDVAGTAVPDGTLFALVVSSNGLFGATGNTFGTNSFITTSVAQATFTQGQTLTVGSTFGTDTVFQLGVVDSNMSTMTGLAGVTSALTLGTNGVVDGRSYAFFFFPGGTLSGGTGTIGSQAGGYNTIITDGDAGFDAGMIIPAEGATKILGAIDPGNGGTALPAGAFQAVNLVSVPEPSAALLGALGALGLLRRRRI